ncbi:uncharacterized protein LOC117169995 [Belonocnema kinseyi]|uniref:uncharacterized protein LOC117169995 n=1 Tax=Belonocnema kinseyi TaxID=2817044 RepID=UPI00143E01BC|nr:uncharacterized protein LOC117169995 [Belonocnema kinseyi]
MNILAIQFLLLAIILNFIGLSLQSLRNRALIDLNKSPVRSPSPPTRFRSRSPTDEYHLARTCSLDNATSSGLLFPSDILECKLQNLKLFRLTSKRNVSHIFELGRYTFPADTPLKLIKRNIIVVPIPIKEHIVISTSDGYIFGILESSLTLAGLYMFYEYKRHDRYKRAKINMKTGKPIFLDPDELHATPVGRHGTITRYFRITRVNRVSTTTLETTN